MKLHETKSILDGDQLCFFCKNISEDGTTCSKGKPAPIYDVHCDAFEVLEEYKDMKKHLNKKS
jgi:hypothetical protein